MTARIGVTLGEPRGVGPEIAVRALAGSARGDARYVLYGSPKLLKEVADRFQLGTFWTDPRKGIDLKPSGPDLALAEFRSETVRAEAVLASLDRAAADAFAGRISAVVTAPIDKSVVRARLPGFTGHTGYLAQKAGVPAAHMLLDNTEIRVVCLTEHVPLREVPGRITEDLIERAVRITARAFRSWFGVPMPRMAVAGLNPHRGETVENSEEERVFAPAIGRLRREGYAVEGPFAADSLFARARAGPWDVILSPYHDQGLSAVKYPGPEKVVNVTLGLPYLRVSPGHGVAYDIAGKKPADPRSFERALQVAVERRLVA